MTVAQIKALTPAQIDERAEKVGQELFSDPAFLKAQCIKVGRQSIKHWIAKMTL